MVAYQGGVHNLRVDYVFSMKAHLVERGDLKAT